jgi:serine/threonine-protein kinase RsbW
MYKRLKIESVTNNLRVVEKAIDEVTNELGIPQDNYGKIMVSAMEAVNNAIVHGNKLNPSKLVSITISHNKDVVKIKVIDQGPGFNPESIPDPTTPENIEMINGRGVFLMSHLADEITFSKKGNSVTMVFKNINA